MRLLYGEKKIKPKSKFISAHTLYTSEVNRSLKPNVRFLFSSAYMWIYTRPKKAAAIATAIAFIMGTVYEGRGRIKKYEEKLKLCLIYTLCIDICTGCFITPSKAP